jgi:hypothetical protein
MCNCGVLVMKNNLTFIVMMAELIVFSCVAILGIFIILPKLIMG